MEAYQDAYDDPSLSRPGEMENGNGLGYRTRSYGQQASTPNSGSQVHPSASSSMISTSATLGPESGIGGASGLAGPGSGGVSVGVGGSSGGTGSGSSSSNAASTPGLQPSSGHQIRPSLADAHRLSSSSGPKQQSSLTTTTISTTSATPAPEAKDNAVPVAFDEGILRGLCDMDGALSLLADRIKQSVASCKQVAVFLRSRADVEEKYARSLSELARTTADMYARQDCKAGTFVGAYHSSLRLQDQLAQNRVRFAARLYEMSEDLLSLAREGERQRKIHKDNGARYQGILQESEGIMDKTKSRFDATAEELERILVAKEGESYRETGMRNAASLSSTQAGGVGSNPIVTTIPAPGGTGKRGIGKAMTKGLFKGKNPAQMQRQEDDVRARMAAASEAFRKAVLESQSLRQEYFNFQLPKILRLLKDCADELDMGTQYHLTRYSFMYESTVMSEGTLINPHGADDAPGLKAIFENIDNRTDFKSYMQNYAVARGTPRGPRREGPYDEGYLPPLPPHVHASQQALASQSSSQQSQTLGGQSQSIVTTPNGIPGQTPPATTDMYATGIPVLSGATFGVSLADQLARDGGEVPKVVEKCAQAIETFGLESMGIYRLSGTTSKVQALKAALDKDVDAVDVMDDQWSQDINVVSSALKLWFRELPEPLLTYGLYHSFIDAARYDNDRLRHIRLHEQVNELPDANYATLKYFMGHLDRVRRKESINQMTVSNLSIVFGPTLLGAPPEDGGLNLEHMNYQCKAIETILEKYQEIFVEEEEDGEESPAQAPAGQA